MKRKLSYIISSAILLGAVSCAKMETEAVNPEINSQDDKVTIEFCVDAAEANPVTKVFSEEPNITSMKVAVFGSSGFLKEYVDAEYEKAEKNYDGTDETVYWYKVNLSLSNSSLKVHFLANGPSSLAFKYESEVIGKCIVDAPQDVYWQRVLLPDGIKAQTRVNDKGETEYITKNADGEIVAYDDYPQGGYLVDPECVKNMTKVPLVRNFAKIKVTADAISTSRVEVLGYALMNYPKQGSVAPYQDGWLMGETMGNYQDYETFADLNEVYAGNLPATASLDKNVPTSFTSAGDYMYTFERPVPTSDATVIIVHANYYPNYSGDSTNKVDCYYKINIQDAAGNYLPIYRNFEYVINIKEIVRAGYSSAADAATATGSGDISADISTQNLTDISDGKSRIYVQYTEKTYTESGTYTLKVKYIPDVKTGEVDNTRVSYQVLTATDPVFATDDSGNYKITVSDTDKEWMTITYTTTEISSNKSQQIKVIGTAPTGSTVYRYVTVRLLSQKEMVVKCDPEYVLKNSGEELDVYISIAKDLPESIFPLYFKIEAENLNLTPNNDNLPVYSGESFLYKETTEDGKVYEDEKGSNAKKAKDGTSIFYYMKTLSYEDYLEYQSASEGEDLVTFATHFKTTDSGSSAKGGIVYVINEYFNDAYDDFLRYDINNFTELKYSSGNIVFTGEGQEVEFSFKTDEIYSSPITVNLTGLKPADTEKSLTWVSGDTYIYEYTKGNTSHSFDLVTTTEDVNVDVALSAQYYNDNNQSCERGLLDFTNEAFTSGSSIAYGNGKTAAFKFDYVEGFVEPITVTFTGLDPTNLEQDYGTFELVSGTTYTFTPSSDKTTTIYFDLTTTTVEDNVSVTISNDHYNSSTTKASRAKFKFSNLSFSTVYLGEGQTGTFTFSYATGAVVPITITFRKAVAVSSDNGKFSVATDNDDGTYTYTYTPNDNTTITHEIKISTKDFGSYMMATLKNESYDDASATKGRTLKIAASALKMTGDYLAYESGNSYSCRQVTVNSSTTTFTPTASTTVSGYGRWTSYSYDGYSYNGSDISYDFDDSTDVTDDTKIPFSYTYSYKQRSGWSSYTVTDTYTATSTAASLNKATSSEPVELEFTTE